MKEQTPTSSSDPLAVDISWFRSLMDERDRRYEDRYRELVHVLSERDRRYEERDRRYEERFDAQNDALKKAEDALREYKASANEFRGTLDDQNTKFIPRTESEITTSQNSKRIEQVRDEARLLLDTLKAEITTIQKLNSVGAGRSQFSNPIMMAIVAAVIAAIIGYLVRSGGAP